MRVNKNGKNIIVHILENISATSFWFSSFLLNKMNNVQLFLNDILLI